MKGFSRGSIMGFARRSRSQSLPLALMSLLLLIAGQNYSTLAQQTLPDDHLVPSMSSSSLPRLPDDFYNDVDGTALSAGFHHTCALEMRPSIEFGGALRCWGFNDHGQASPPQGHFIQVSSGHLFSCGIRIDETVECWGQMAPPSEGLFLQISAGEFHVCGITKESTAKCWGGHVLAALRSPPGEFVQVSSGKDFSCGLRPNGRAACWGDTKKGKTRAPAGVLFKQLSASPYKHYACGVELHERGIVCWGEQNHHGYAANRTGPFSQVTTGNKVTCGIRELDGHIECWGLVSRLITTEHLPHEWEQVTSGFQHTCGINAESEVACWGPTFESQQNAVDVPDGFIVA